MSRPQTETQDQNERKLYKITLKVEEPSTLVSGDPEAEAFMRFTEHLLSMKEEENTTKVANE